ncbi:MAG: BlaI/MecI/CopY family transcriptional regulator [Nocardioidaceae bacterium]
MRQLGPLEAVVMARVWATDRPVLVREVLEQIQRERNIAYTTVMTVMDNLHRKGVLSREQEGRAYRYRAVRSREEHTAELMGEVLATSGDRAATLMHFVQQIDDGELETLRKAGGGQLSEDGGGGHHPSPSTRSAHGRRREATFGDQQ